jgi:hypothetical protein
MGVGWPRQATRVVQKSSSRERPELRNEKRIMQSREDLAKLVHFVILNEVQDLSLLKIRDSALRSE